MFKLQVQDHFVNSKMERQTKIVDKRKFNENKQNAGSSQQEMQATVFANAG